jgi:6-phosphofructokinase 2
MSYRRDARIPAVRACASGPRMRPIVTLTLNPAIDVACTAEKVEPTHKIRTSGDTLEPGGGGINVSRVLQRLGAPTRAIFLAGGASGQLLDDLLERAGLERTRIVVAGETRVSLTVVERSTGLEYRFVPEGPQVAVEELAACRAAVAAIRCDCFVASGSLPRGAADDFYAELVGDVAAAGGRFVLDTSGAELREALARGGIFLVKPSRAELESLTGRELPQLADLASAAADIVASGGAEHVAVTLGKDGALLANGDGALYSPALPVEATSAVGAGDSFLGGMVKGVASGGSIVDAFKLGIAGGAAAVLCPGTALCGTEDVDRLLSMVPEPRPVRF